MTKQVVFAGCSFTAGLGWNPNASDENFSSPQSRACKNEPRLWVNLLCKNNHHLKDFVLVNIGQGGASNTDIFENATEYLLEHRDSVKYLFVQWTAMPRYSFNIGYENQQPWTGIRLARNKAEEDYINDLMDRVKSLHNLHWEILTVLKYSSLLSRLGEMCGTRCFFINGLCPWDRDYFERITGDTVLASDYTRFNQKDILNADTISDADIKTIYNKIHDDYTRYPLDNWINLYDSFSRNQVDTNYDGMHPGEKSNVLYADMVSTWITKKLANR